MATTLLEERTALTHAGLTAVDCRRGGPGQRDGQRPGCGSRSRRRSSARKHAFARPEFCRGDRRVVLPGKPQVGSGAEPVSHQSGVGLSCFYDPATAQFLSRDPIAAITRSAYGYVNGNPLNATDPSGLAPWDDWCIDIGDANCDSIAEQHPEVTQGVVDFSSGVLEANPITATTNAMGLTDTGQYADECSGWYSAGKWGMTAIDIAIPVGKVGMFAKAGREIKIGKNFRFAPFGNRTGHALGRWPHYHRRGLDASGATRPGQGIGRHRPWETKSPDTSIWDRF